jgi:hypothetical protein
MSKLPGLAILFALSTLFVGCLPVTNASTLQAKADGIPLFVEEVFIGTGESRSVRNPGSGLGYVRMRLVNTGTITLRAVTLRVRARDAVGNPIRVTNTGDDVVEIRLSQVLPVFDPDSITVIAGIAAASGDGIWGPFLFATTPSCVEVVDINLGDQGVLEGAALQRATRDTTGNLCR